MSKKLAFYIFFYAALIVVFFIVLSYVLPGFVKPKTVVIGEVRPFSFVNQDGETVTQDITKGKVVAVNYFFTTCKGICPKMEANLYPVHQAFKNEPDFLILSHTSDPDRDSAATLKHYADSLKIDTRKWVLLTGRKDSLYHHARHSYKIDDPANFVRNVEDDFLHTQFIALVNRKGEIVRIYDGIKPSEMKEMKNEITKLLKE